jgi:hypothetical protein
VKYTEKGHGVHVCYVCASVCLTAKLLVLNSCLVSAAAYECRLVKGWQSISQPSQNFEQPDSAHVQLVAACAFAAVIPVICSV